ncbi:porin [Aquisalimonas lutea]|uniref:porin n=1 Tax=Aquisalimonas lutea TaxID=1327750 RepID=UPI0025B2D1C6|nr:porin [Aquisalimonas lutea]MDN3517669.1 porin [Aquisalimonas lutea]
MKKLSTTALVIAAGMASSAQAADFEVSDNTTVGVYGEFAPMLVSEKDGAGESRSEFTDNGSIIGFSVDQRLDNGVTLFGVAEFEFLTDNSDNDFVFDAGYIGARGNFGRVQLGNFDSVYEDLIIDATEVAELAEITDESVMSEDNQVAYYSPSFNGFSFRAQARYMGDGDDNAIAGQDSAEVGFSLAGGYSADNWGVYAGYDDRGSEVVDQYDANGNVTGQDYADNGTYGVSGIYGIGPVELAAKYAIQDLEDNDPAGDDITYAALRGTVTYGPGDVYAAVQEVMHDNDDVVADRTEFTVGVSHGVADNLDLWAEAGYFDQQNDAGDVMGVGAIYEF